MKNARLCLIDAVNPDFATSDPPLNLARLASFVIAKNIIPKQNVLILNSTYDDIFHELLLFRPNIIGLSVLTPFYKYARLLALEIKKRYNCTVIIGGYHISGLPRSLEAPFDIGVVGEGEETLGELLQVFLLDKKMPPRELRQIRGLAFLNEKKKVEITPSRQLLDLNQAPQTMWDLLPRERVAKYMTLLVENMPKTVKIASVYSARGCPYRCIFCAHQILWGNQSGFRYYSIQTVGNEIDYLYKHFQVNCIQILDDTFAVSKQRLKDLIHELQKRKLLGKLYFYNIFIRANLIDEEFVRLLKQFGTATVFIGMESGNQRMLNYLKRGSLKTRDIQKAVDIFNRYKIHIAGSFMIFSPEETKHDIKDTQTLARWFTAQKYAYILLFHVTTPYPGTVLWNQTVGKEIINVKRIDWDKYVLFNMRDPDKMTHVFFPGEFSKQYIARTYETCMALSRSLRTKVVSRNDWIRAEKTTTVKNHRLYSTNRILQRFQKLFTNPQNSVRKLIKKPSIMSYVMQDVTNYFLGR